MEDYIKRYRELYDEMAQAKDPKKMIVFGDAERWVFTMVAEQHPELAERWLSKLEAGRWHNYLSRSEAEGIAQRMQNQDGTRGPHWDYETFKAAVESLGGKMTDEPFYNCWALWIAANMIYSDHYKSLSKYIPKDQEPLAYYSMAVEQLKDIDRPRFIRDYYGL